MQNPPADEFEETISNGSAKPVRTRGLLPQAMEELQLSVEELRVAEEEMRVQNEELGLSRLRLEAERQRYLDLFEFAPDGYLVTDLDGIILEANRAASRLLGISARFLKKRSLGTLIALPDVAGFQPRLKALAASGEGSTGEWTVQLRRRPTGMFQAAVTASLCQSLLGQPPTLRWMIRDITQRRMAEEERMALAQAHSAQAEAEAVQRRTSAILEAITDQFFALDTEWRFVSMNASAARLAQAAGKDPAALIGEIIWEAYPTAMESMFLPEAMRAVEIGQMTEYEEFSHGWGRWMQVRIFPVESGVSVYSTDVTERKEAEAALRTAYERERRIAETLQQILLHTPPPEAYSSLSIETFYEAASEEAAVGGDFSDVFTYGDGMIALVVGDVSGKGLGAAAMIAEVKYALRAILRDCRQPEIALAKLNDFVCEAQRQNDLGSDHLVALSLAVFQPSTKHLSYVTAGGEPLLLIRSNGGAEAVGASGLLLGIQPDAVYTVSEADLAPLDTLLMVTDGLTEARRDGTLFGFEALQAQAAQHLSSGSTRAGGQALIDHIRTWAAGTFQDDVCLLIARRPEAQ
ncbi:MAG: SpoIIE family protein phosphatase [Janthinobacterium lividum]